MPSTAPSTHPLHCGTCIEDLNRQSEVKLDHKNPNLVCKRLGKLLDEGNKYKSMGDDENAYIFYMRFMNCISWLQKTPDYAKNKGFLKPYVSGSKVEEILNTLEDLSQRLTERYNAKKLKNSTKQLVDTVEKMQIESDHNNDDDLLDEMGDIQLNLPDTPTDDPAIEEAETSITCMEMFQAMQKLNNRIIIIDIRTQDDFQESHIESNQCINIPTNIIRIGILATDLFKSLHGKERTRRIIQHRGREHCDLIVLLDWQTTKLSLKPNNQLEVLKKILREWDPIVSYKRIVILDGGYKEWLTRYPTFTTNANVTVPDIEGHSVAEILEHVQYPDWNQSDEDQPVTKVKFKPVPPRNLKPTLNEKKNAIIRNSNTLNDQNTEGLNTRNTNDHLNKFKNQNDIANNAFINGTKSVVSHGKVVASTNENVSKLSQNDKVRNKIINSVESNIIKPSIDRSSKPSTEKTYDSDSEKVLNLLRLKSDLVKRQLKLEKEKLMLESRLFGREDDDDINSVQKAEKLKRMSAIHEAMVEIMEEISIIREKLNKYKQNGVEVNSAYHDEKVQLELDIGLAEHEARTTAIQRGKLISEHDKKLGDNSEIKQEKVSTPPNETGEDIKKTPLKQDGPSMNSSLKRSYSSPNLAQLETRKETAGGAFDDKMPQVDRTSKPLQQQHRNNITNSTVINWQPLRRDREQRMSPVFGNMHPGITGLKNLGNSCYMNSIIQCLSNTTGLARYFIHGFYTDDLNTKNKKTQGQVVEEVAQVIKALWCGHYRSISPRDLKVAIGQYKMQFESYEQQDSHEFLTFLLDWMHNDLKTKAKLEPDRLVSNAEKEWDKAMGGQTSIISQLFFGQLRSTITCATCGNSSTTYENFNSLTLSLPKIHQCTLDDCIRKYVSGQRVSGWRCPSCKAARDATKKFDFIKLAPVIVVHLNRFGETGGWIQKINTAVDFPLTSLDLRSYVAHDSGNTTTTTNSYHQTYHLYAVSNHYGTMEGGHYTAYCNSASQNKWYKYDDHTVREVSPNEVKSQTASAYLLFYTNVRNSSYIDI